MKNKGRKSGVIGAAVAVVLCIANWLFGRTTGHILGLAFWGGEVCTYMGLGVMLNRFYPLYHVDNPVDVSWEVHFDIISFTVTFLICWGISHAIQSHIAYKKACEAIK